MTDRIHSLIVVLEKDERDDDCDAITSAILQMRGVAAVAPCVSTPESTMAEVRARHNLRTKLWKLLEEPRADKT